MCVCVCVCVCTKLLYVSKSNCVHIYRIIWNFSCELYAAPKIRFNFIL